MHSKGVMPSRSTASTAPAKDLGSFIEDNHRLLSTAGVLAALAVFSINLQIRPLSSFLAVCFLAMCVLVMLELIGRYPFPYVGLRLYLFGALFAMALFTLTIYLFIAYRDDMGSLLVPLVAIILLTTIGKVIEKNRRLRMVLFPSEAGFRRDATRVLLLVGFVLIWVVAGWIAAPINQWLDEAAAQFR